MQAELLHLASDSQHVIAAKSGHSIERDQPEAATGANAMPIAPSVSPTSSVEQVGWVCNPWGRCWWQPNYYRRYGYYRRYRFDDDDWPRRYGYGPRYWGPGYSWGGGHGGWRRGWDDDNEQ